MADVTFLADGGMDFAVRCVLSGAPYATAEPGEVLAVLADVVDGDARSWRDAWVGRGRALAAAARSDAAAGRRRSACGTALRAANYLFAGNYYAPACTDAAGARAVWAEHRAAWDLAVDCWPTPASAVAIETPAGRLPGYWFGGAAPPGERRPVVVLVGGIETPMSDAPMTGLTDALDRGYRVLLVDGPGQGAALYGGGLALAPRWDDVWPAVLDWVAAHPGVDAGRVTLIGINHGGLWAGQGAAVAGDRVAALVLDPAVTGLVDDVLASLPDDLATLWREQPGALDAAVAERAATDPDLAFWAAKTVDPFSATPAGEQDGSGAADRPDDGAGAGAEAGPDTTTRAGAGGGAETLGAALDRLAAAVLTADDLAAITCPTLVCVAEEASAFVGQHEPVLAALGDRATRLDFTTAEGAGLDCEIGAPQVRNARVYDALDALCST